MKRKGILASAGAGAGLLILALVRFERTAPIAETVLSDGTRVQVHAVTRGTNHVADLRSLAEKMLAFVPKGWVPAKWVPPQPRSELATPTNAIVVWLHADKQSAAQRYVVTDTNGQGGFISAPEIYRAANGLFPMVLKDWPRRDPQIAITFLGDFPNGAEFGRLVFPNPDRSTEAPLEAGAARPRGTNGALALELVSLEVLPNGQAFPTRAGAHWGCRARLRIAERGRWTEDWIVQQLWLSDSGGNRRRFTGPRGWTNGVFEIFGAPLWKDDPVWRVEADLTRAANFPPEETATFAGVPMPSKEGPMEAVFRTNLLGQAITLRSMKVAQARNPELGMHSMGSPGFTIEVDSRDREWVPRVVSIISDSGEVLRVPGHGYGDGYAVMRFPAPQGIAEPKSLTVGVTVQRRQRIELVASAAVAEE